MQQIAEQVGVSKFAVSQALSGKPGVAEDTRTRIVQTANELGYFWKTKMVKKSPSAGADSGTGGKAAGEAAKGTVIILMPNVRFQSRESLFWGRIIDGVSAALAEREVGVMMVTENYSERSLKSINPSGVLGLIGIGCIATNLLLEIRHLGIPFVLVDHEDALIPSDTVFMNNYDSMRQMTGLVLQAGRRDVRFVGGPRYSRSFHDRWVAFRIVMEEHGLAAALPDEDPLLQLEENEYLVIEQEIGQMHARGKLPSAFICANDFLAYTVMNALVKLGVKVPDTVAVTGFDHTDEQTDPNLNVPALSTIDTPIKTLGKRAVEMLYARLADPDRPFEKALLHGNVMLRDSFNK